MFADDATIVYGEQNYLALKTKMTNDLKIVNDWMKKNQLAINFTKTNFIFFYQRNSNCDDLFENINIDGKEISRVKVTKYLGLHLNESLSFVDHINQIKSKISKFVGVLKRISKHVNKETKTMIYFAYIHSVLIYMCPIWCRAPNFKVNELQRLQNKAIKQILNLPALTPSVTLYGEKFLSLASLFEYETDLLIFKLKHSLMKSDITFTHNYNVHSHLTRCMNYLRTVFRKTNCTQNSISTDGVKCFNRLPSHLQNENNFLKFKKELKIFFCTP